VGPTAIGYFLQALYCEQQFGINILIYITIAWRAQWMPIRVDRHVCWQSGS